MTLSAKGVTSTGLTLVCPSPGSDKIARTMQTWIIPECSSVELAANRENLYHLLSAGRYRIVNEIMDFRGTGDYDKYYAEFIVE